MVMNYDGAPQPEAPLGPGAGMPTGTVIGGRFRIETLLGAGGWGPVYRSVDLKTQKPVAIRILAPVLAADEATLEHLRAEVKLSSALQHKNIAALFGMGKEGDARYVASEFIEGQSLRQLLEKKRGGGRTFSLKGAYNVLAHACNALQQIHQTTVHGLPGPGAILVNQAGRVKLCEAGLLRALPAGSPVLGWLGDRYCLAPEVAGNPAMASPASDIYSLGVVLYELLTGRRPATPEALPASTLIAGLPNDVDDVLARCLARDPAQRFVDPGQLKAAFYASVQSAREQAEVEGVVEAGPRPPGIAPVAGAAMPALAPRATGPAFQPSPLAAPAAPTMPAAAPPAQALGGPPPSAQPSTPGPPAGLSIEEHLLRAESVRGERWLVHKDRLDFGPFTLADLLRQVLKGQFSGDDVVLDQDTGERSRIMAHPMLRDFSSLASRHVAADAMVKAETAQRQQDKKHRTVMVVSVTLALAVLGAGGVIAAYFLYFRKPTTLEKVVYKDKARDPEANIKGIDITWKNEPTDQAARRKKLGKKRVARKGVAGGDDVTYLGDATKDGGDALLSQDAIQRVMQSNFRKLTKCVYEEMRRAPGLRNVNIDFSIRGSGSVGSVTVNGQSGGPFAGCVLAQMLHIKFPPFDGTVTRASFSMSLK